MKEIVKLLDASTKLRKDVSIIVVDLKSSDIVSFLNNIAPEIRSNRVIEIAKGAGHLSLVCDDPLALRLSKEKKKDIISYKKELAAITMASPKKAVDTPGILAYILNQFAKNNINIYEIVSSYNEVSFIIDRKLALKARKLLGKFL